MDRQKLIEYLPTFMQQFIEMQQIMKANDAELDRLYERVEKTLDNAFIEDCNAEGIAKFEKQLHIIPNAQEDLETRKARVMLRWNESVPYTIRVLYKQLNALCGVNDYEIEADLQHYMIAITSHLKTSGQIEELERMCKKILPENMYYVLSNWLNRTTYGSVHIGGIIASRKKTKYIESSMRTVQTMTGDIHMDVAVTSHTKRYIEQEDEK